MHTPPQHREGTMHFSDRHTNLIRAHYLQKTLEWPGSRAGLIGSDSHLLRGTPGTGRAGRPCRGRAGAAGIPQLLSQTGLQLIPGHRFASQQQELLETGKGGTNAAILCAQSRLENTQRNISGNPRENQVPTHLGEPGQM